MPDLYIITGSNGAGKSTFGHSYLPKNIQDNNTIFDGDKLYLLKKRELYLSRTPSMKEAGRLAEEWLSQYFEEQVTDAIRNNRPFIYEGHFRDDGSWATPERFKAAGYIINVIFLGLNDTTSSEFRVFERAKFGGHNVPPHEIEKNFYGNLIQLNKRFETIDFLKIVDTSEPVPKILASLKNGEIQEALEHLKIPLWFEENLPAIFKKIIENKN